MANTALDTPFSQHRVAGTLTSRTFVPYPILGCLVAAERILGPDRVWEGINPTQVEFARYLTAKTRGDIGGLEEIESLASYSASEINTFLRDRGFSIALEPFHPLEFGTAAVLKVIVEWLVRGTKTTLTCLTNGKQHPAVRIPNNGVQFYELPDHPEKPIAQIPTKNGDQVFLMKLTNPPSTDFGLVDLAMDIVAQRVPSNRFNNVIFPMVDLDHEVDISWMCGLKTSDQNGTPAVVSQAKQQTKLKMNEVGAKVESAAALGVLRCAVSSPPPKPDLIFDKPFFAAFYRQGMQFPFFTGFLCPDVWKNPGAIS